MELTKVFIVVVGWILFPACALALAAAGYFVFRQDALKTYLTETKQTLITR